MIPKIIHYCWFGGNELPDEYKYYIETWKKHCPDYQIKEWNEKTLILPLRVMPKKLINKKSGHLCQIMYV